MVTVKTHSFQILPKANQHETYFICYSFSDNVLPSLGLQEGGYRLVYVTKHCFHFLLVRRLYSRVSLISLYLEKHFANVMWAKVMHPWPIIFFCTLLYTLFPQAWPMETFQASPHPLSLSLFLLSLFYEEIFISNPVT